MNYIEALNYIDNINILGSKLGLERVTILLDKLDNPQDKIKTIHVAGTNGKGSISSMLSNILIASGYKTALYTSPHLESYNERYMINGVEISNDNFAKYVSIIKKYSDEMENEGYGTPTVFEQLTAVAFLYFYDNKVDYAVIEVGLGGRFDATNSIKKPVLSVIASISLEHTEYLGNNVESIAFEKGGIIKPGCPVVLYRQDSKVYDVINNICKEKKSKLYYIENEKVEIIEQNIDQTIMSVENNLYSYNNLILHLIGNYQIKNCCLVLLAVYALKESGVNLIEESILKGISLTRWKGRMEVCEKSPLVIIDGAHNPDGIHMLTESVKNYFSNKRIVLLIGVLGDKNYNKMVEEIVPLADTVVITEPDSERALSIEELKKVVKNYCDEIYSFEDIDKAYSFAHKITRKEDVLLCAGSLYLIGRLRTIIMGGN